MSEDSDIPFIRGRGRFGVDVVGANGFRESFDMLCGARRMQQVKITTRARLQIQEDEVAVTINGLPVGFLSPSDARAFDRIVRYGKLSKFETFECQSQIRGGWNREMNQAADYSVRLDLSICDD